MANRRKDSRVGLPAMACLKYQGKRVLGVIRDLSSRGANFATYELKNANDEISQLARGSDVMLDIYGINLCDLNGQVRQGKMLGCGMSFGIEFGELDQRNQQSLVRFCA